jgi:hypothetical protein
MKSENAQAGRSLYWCKVKVRPTPKNPYFFEVAFGYFCVCVLDRNAESAGEFATLIVLEQPYEILGTNLLCFPASTIIEPKKQLIEQCESEALQKGYSMLLIGCRPGVDEGDFAREFEDTDRGF